MLRSVGINVCLTAFVLFGPATSATCQDATDMDAGDSGDDGDDGDGQSFESLNAQADEAAEQGDFQQAIRLWREAIPYDQSPYVECRGALQRVYIRVAEHVVTMVNNGDLDDDAAFEWFKSKVTNVWGNSTCNTP